MPICRLRSDSVDLPRWLSSGNTANRIFNSMSDQQRQPKGGPVEPAPTERPAELADAQRRRAEVVDVLAETLIDLILKQRRGGAVR